MAVVMYNQAPVDLKHGTMYKNKLGGQHCIVFDKMFIQSPAMKVPFGLSEYVQDQDEVKYSIDLSFQDWDANNRIHKMKTYLETIDEKMILMAEENSQRWFGKKMSKEVISELYKPIVKESKQPDKYAPTFKLKIRNINDLLVYKNKELVDVDSIKPGSYLRVIYEWSPVWFVNKQFGITAIAKQIDICSTPDSSEISFQEDL